MTGAHDYFLQTADVELGLRDQVDFGQAALATGLGAGLGGVFGGAIGAFTSISPAISNRINKYYNEGEIIEQGNNIDRKIAEEEYAIDKVVDEKLIKESNVVD